MRSKELPSSIEEAEKILQEEGFENPRLEARLLWHHVFDGNLTQKDIAHLREHVSKLYQGIPIQRQIGYTKVSGRKINVTSDVLLPGPEIEIMLGAFFDYVKDPRVVIDLCTGCGVLASIIGERFSESKVYATDISQKVLKVARTNIHSTNVVLMKGDLFESLKGKGVSNADVLISNPPYCKTGDIAQLPKQIRDHTPKIAIDGGEDGYFLHRRIIEGATNYVRTGGLVILENEVGQTQELKRMFERKGYAVESTRKNGRGEERVIVARRIR